MLPPGVVLGGDGELLQRATSFCFPLRIAGLPRIDVRLYDGLGASVGVTYRAGQDGDPWVTVFVFGARTGESLVAHFAEAEAELARRYAGLYVLTRRRFAVAVEDAKRALGLELEARVPAGLELGGARVWLTLLQSGDVYVKLRVSSAERSANDARRLLADTYREVVRPFLERRGRGRAAKSTVTTLEQEPRPSRSGIRNEEVEPSLVGPRPGSSDGKSGKLGGPARRS